MIAAKDREISITARVLLKRSVLTLSLSQLYLCGFLKDTGVRLFLKFAPVVQVLRSFIRTSFPSSSEERIALHGIR